MNTTQYNPYGQVQQPVNQQAPSNGFIPISGGEETALNYGLTANSTVMFISPDTNELFMRGTDMNGMTNMFRAFDIKEKPTNYQTNLMGGNFATKEDITKIASEIDELKKFIEELTSPAKG